MFRKKHRDRAGSDCSNPRFQKTPCPEQLRNHLIESIGKSASDGDLASTRPQISNVCLLGDENVGKSSLSLRIVKGSFKPDYVPTIGGQCHSAICGLSLERQCHLSVRDVSGNPAYRSVIHKFIRGADVLVFVFDLTSRKSFENLPSWRTLLTNLRIETAANLILCGNKADRENERQVSRSEGRVMSKRLNCSRYLETSAKNGSCVKELKCYIINSPEYSDNFSIASSTFSGRFTRSAWQNTSIIRRTASAGGFDTMTEEKTKVQIFFFPQTL